MEQLCILNNGHAFLLEEMASDWEQSLFLLDMPSISRQDLSHMCKGPPEMMTSRSQNTLFLHSLLVSSRVARAAVSCSHELYFQEWSPQPFYSTYSWLPFLFCSSPFICRHRLNLWCVRCISCQQTWLAFLLGCQPLKDLIFKLVTGSPLGVLDGRVQVARCYGECEDKQRSGSLGWRVQFLFFTREHLSWIHLATDYYSGCFALQW